MNVVFILTLSVIFYIYTVAGDPQYSEYGFYQGRLKLPARVRTYSQVNYDIVPAINSHSFRIIQNPIQYYYPKVQKFVVPTVYYVKPLVVPVPIPIDYEQRLTALAKHICSTFNDINDIALAEDWEVGNRIKIILDWEAKKVEQILVDYRAGVNKWEQVRRRYKRQTGSNGNGPTAENSMGDILVNASSKINQEKKKLSSASQKKINKKYKDGVKNCSADSCKAASKLLDSVEDAESERQRRP